VVVIEKVAKLSEAAAVTESSKAAVMVAAAV
jgi:hypothetical protein